MGGSGADPPSRLASLSSLDTHGRRHVPLKSHRSTPHVPLFKTSFPSGFAHSHACPPHALEDIPPAERHGRSGASAHGARRGDTARGSHPPRQRGCSVAELLLPTKPGPGLGVLCRDSQPPATVSGSAGRGRVPCWRKGPAWQQRGSQRPPIPLQMSSPVSSPPASPIFGFLAGARLLGRQDEQPQRRLQRALARPLAYATRG